MLTTIRNNLSIALAVAAAVFAGIAYITNMHYQTLASRMETVELRNAQLVETTKSQAIIIDELARQREVDDSIVSMLTEQQRTLQTQGDHVRRKLKELASNDKQIRALFDIKLPPAAIRLLIDSTKTGGQGPASGANPSAELAQ